MTRRWPPRWAAWAMSLWRVKMRQAQDAILVARHYTKALEAAVQGGARLLLLADAEAGG